MQCFQAPTTHPFGVSPSRDSSNEFGNSAAVTGSILTGSRPAPFARTGSKSTNHDLKIARAIASNVPFIRRFDLVVEGSEDVRDGVLLATGGALVVCLMSSGNSAGHATTDVRGLIAHLGPWQARLTTLMSI